MSLPGRNSQCDRTNPCSSRLGIMPPRTQCSSQTRRPPGLQELLQSPALNRKNPSEKRTIPPQGKTEILGRAAIAAIPLAVKLRPFICKYFRQALHGLRDQTISLLHRSARLIHKVSLDGIPATAKLRRLFGQKQRPRSRTMSATHFSSSSHFFFHHHKSGTATCLCSLDRCLASCTTNA